MTDYDLRPVRTIAHVLPVTRTILEDAGLIGPRDASAWSRSINWPAALFPRLSRWSRNRQRLAHAWAAARAAWNGDPE